MSELERLLVFSVAQVAGKKALCEPRPYRTRLALAMLQCDKALAMLKKA